MSTNENPGLPFISLKEVTIRIKDRIILPKTSWEIKTGEQWAILGANGAGKSSLVKALIGDLPHIHGKITCHFHKKIHDAIGYVSFDLQEHLISREDIRDKGRYFAGKLNEQQKAKETILEGFYDHHVDMELFNHIVDNLGIRYLLNRGIRNLSSGEMRKVIISRALMKSPEMLILDEPFAGLDTSSRRTIQETIERLITRGIQVILVTHRREEILPSISNIICIRNGKVFLQGPREEILTPENIKRIYPRRKTDRLHLVRDRKLINIEDKSKEIIVNMVQVTVKYGEVTVLERQDWTIRRGENWALVGPNGSGKSTLLSLITADNPQAYANEIYLFGKCRGTGESIWDIKRHIGVVSSELQIRYKRDITAYEVTASGFFDSVGLYQRLTAKQKKQVEDWLNFFGIANLSERLFTRLSYGERRMILLARAMVKSPDMLILDEPCEGLDQENRHMLLEMIEEVGSQTDTTVIYVTHFESEIPTCTNHILHLKKPACNSSL